MLMNPVSHVRLTNHGVGSLFESVALQSSDHFSVSE